MEGIRKGYFFSQKWYIKGQGFGPREGASPYKTFLITPNPPPPPLKMQQENDVRRYTHKEANKY